MKKVFKIIPLFAFLLASVQSIAQEDYKMEKEKKKYEFTRERDISKTYPASGNSLVLLQQFGDINITTWDKNEIKVDIHIMVSSTNKEWADRDFEKIDVTDKKEGSVVTFETVFGKEKSKTFSCNNCSNTMEITYEVKMPSSNKLTIDNSFGGIKIPDYNGPLSISSKYGSVIAGKMAKLEKLDIEFGSVQLKYLSNADVTFKYTTINIENLSGSNKIRTEFCDYSQINLGSDLTSLRLYDSYSTVQLRPAANFSASYTVSSSYGDFIDKTGSIKRTDTPDQYGPDTERRYEGKTGAGAATITVTTSFGTIMIGEGSAKDMVKKKKVRA